MKLNFWPFNRNKSDESTLPEEVQNYYQAEKRERRGVAGLLAVGTLLVTVVLALGLFFGGRALYRAIFDNDSGTTETAQQDDAEQQEADSNSQDEDTSDADQPTATPNPAPTPSSTPTPTPSTPQSQNTTSTTPNTGPNLPNTGPDADL
jgi:cytoskeletal protein RodZ